jgi:hypothetical protein
MRVYGLMLSLLLGCSVPLTALPSTPIGQTPKPTGATPQLMMDLSEGLLTVKLHNVPWTTLLPEIEHHTGIHIHVEGALVGTLTQELEALPLEQGLRRLFRQANVIWFYAPGSEPGAMGARLVRVWLLPKEDTAPEARHVRSLPSGPMAAEKRAMPDVMEKAEEGVSPADEATPEEDGSVEEQDPAERLKALDVFAREGNTEAIEQGILDPDEAVRVRALELLEQGEAAGQ